MQSKYNYFDAGTLEIEIVSIRNKNGQDKIIGKKLIPNSAKIGINFGDICYSIEFTVPNITGYFVPMINGVEIKVYLDGEFRCGGYIIGQETKKNSVSYKAIGYGYEITKTFCLPLTGYTKGISVSTFILQTIRQNLIKRKKIIIVSNETEKRTEVYTRNVRVAFVLYDPNNLGDEIINIQTESKYEENILSYLNNFIKPSNLFIRCLGNFDDMKGYIKENILNNTINNNILSNNISLDDPNDLGLREQTVFVLELYKPITKQTGGSITLDSDKKYDFSIKSEGYISDNIINQQPTFRIDYSNRYGCYFATSKNQPNINTGTNNAYAEDPVINDGTATVIKFDLNLDINRLQSLLYYEVNKRIAESFTYDCTVIGFRQGLNIFNVNNGIEKGNLAFWDINHSIKVTDNSNGVKNNQFLIKGLVMNWGKSGATTNLNLTLPNAYTQEKPPAQLESEYLDEIKREEEKRKNFVFSKKEGYGIYLDRNIKNKENVTLEMLGI